MTTIDARPATPTRGLSHATRARITTVLTPVASVMAALLVGAVLIAFAGENPVDIYRTMFSEALFTRSGWRETLLQATPLALIAVGLGLGFRAGVWNIGAEGQLIVGAVLSIAVIGSVNDAPGIVLIPLGLVLGAVGGALWASIAGYLAVRHGVNTVISTLLLVFIAEPLLNWAVRSPLKDPESFLPQSRVIGNATLPQMGFLDLHIGFLLVLIVVPVAAYVLRRTRFGFLIRAHGGNRFAVYANETRESVMPMAMLVLGGSLAGIAGFIQLAGVQTRVGSGTAAGFGFTAIIVAILGRNDPLGVLIAAVALSAMLVGAEAAQRDSGLPVALVQSVQALVVIFVAVGDAVASRVSARRARRRSRAVLP